MRTMFGVIVVVGLALPVPVAAQESLDQAASVAVQASGQASKDSRATAQKEAQAVPIEEKRAAMASTSNVQVELTISDQSGAAAAEKKTVTMIVSSGSWGKIRASAEAFQKSTASKIVPVGLNVDARPWLQPDGTIRLELTLVYSPVMLQSTNDTAQTRPTELNQSLTVSLQNGKPLVISQAADPVSDRKIIVEAKATVLK